MKVSQQQLHQTLPGPNTRKYAADTVMAKQQYANDYMKEIYCIFEGIYPICLELYVHIVI